MAPKHWSKRKALLNPLLRSLTVERLESRRLLSVQHFGVPQQIADISSAPETDGGGGRQFVNVGNTLYFTADDGIHGWELWKTDGTAASTQFVKDVYPGTSEGGAANHSFPKNLLNYNGKLYFTAERATETGLWSSDGTESGTVLVASGVNDDVTPLVVGGKLYFTKAYAPFSANLIQTHELWEFDGASTRLVYSTGPKVLENGLYSLVDFNGTLYFLTNLWADHTNKMWKVVGGVAQAVVNMPANYYDSTHVVPPDVLQEPSSLTIVGNKMFFAADYTDLWVSDGTTAGTQFLKEFGDPLNSSSLNILATLNGQLIFQADDNALGFELWRSDSTLGGTINLGNFASGDADLPFLNEVDFRRFNNQLYFVLDDRQTGQELWKTNGTAGGTVRLTEINAGAQDSIDNLIGVLGDKLYFSARDVAHGSELWAIDAASDVLAMVNDILPGSGGSFPAVVQDFVGGFPGGMLDGRLYFVAGDGIHGSEVWSTDGTAAGTSLLKNIKRQPDQTLARFFTAVDESVYFYAIDDEHGSELWKTDSVGNGATLVKDINPTGSSNPSLLTKFGNRLAFVAQEGASGAELSISDGTADGTYVIDAISPGASSSDPADLTVAGSSLFISATQVVGQDVTEGFETGNLGALPWSTNGWSVQSENAIAGSYSAASPDLAFGSAYLQVTQTTTSGVLTFSFNETSFSFDGILHFFIDGEEQDLFRFPGGWQFAQVPVSAGTHTFRWEVTDVFFGPRVYIDDIVFPGHTKDRELWKSDGTLSGTTRVKDINPTGNSLRSTINGTSQNSFIALGQVLYFVADDGVHGSELWRSNGTEAGTMLVKDINSQGASSNIENLTAFNGKLYFGANDGASGSELWVSDGTPEGTTMVKDVVAGPDGSNAAPMGTVNGNLLFNATTGVWKTDGAAAGTSLVHSVNWAGSNTVNLGSSLYFAGDDGIHGNELWKSDGTPGGTQLVFDASPGYADAISTNFFFGDVDTLVNVDGTLFFTATTRTAIPNGGVWVRNDLWTSDGTASGTRLVMLDDSPMGSRVADMSSVNGSLFFRYEGEPWVLAHSGDFDVDGDRDGADFLTWQRGLESLWAEPGATATLTATPLSMQRTLRFGEPAPLLELHRPYLQPIRTDRLALIITY
jgi:ELWxxDGT repeat protein